MALIPKPSNLSLTWASAGDILDPGDTKYATGWEVEIPPRQWFNYLDNRQDEAIAHINQRGIAQWDATTDYEAAGKSYVQGSNGTVYKSVAASGPATVVQDPATDSTATYWVVSFQDVDGVRIGIASATTVDLTTAAPNTRHINITGTTTITGFTVTVGKTYFVRFDGALTLTNSASLVTQSGANILTAAGDTCIVRATAANAVEVLCGRFLVERGIGVGQTYQDLTASRASATTYTNTSGRSIFVIVQGNTSAVTAFVNGATIVKNESGNDSTSFIVPAGATYSATVVTLLNWTELR